MSASPATSAADTPAANGVKAPAVRRKVNNDPFVRKNQRNRPRRPPPPGGEKKLATGGEASQEKPTAPTSKPEAAPVTNGDKTTEEKPTSVVEYPLYTTKKSLLNGARMHVARLISKKRIDLLNDHEFTRPVRLQRRDPRAPPSGAGGRKQEFEGPAESKEDSLDVKEREAHDIQKREREAQRQADLAQIAPTVNAAGGHSKKPGAFQKKTQQVFRGQDTPQRAKENKLRYEESLPWHLEDFDNKNIWVGQYETALSEINMALVVGQESFHMVPIEKYYRFKPTNLFPTLSLEEAEALQKKRFREPRWVMESQAMEKTQEEEDRNRKMGSKLFIGKWEKGANARSGATNMKSEFADTDELDFEDGADDDEGDGDLGGDDDEVKQAESRIKREQREANIFGMNDEKSVDREEADEQKARNRDKELSKSLRKALIRREKNDDYDESDTDRNPYTSESEDQDSDEESRKEEERRKAEEKADKTKSKDNNNKSASGSSSKGTNTPSGRNKFTDPLKKASAGLKRSGSPGLSDLSGNESARKKSKKKHVPSSHPPGTSTPGGPGSRSLSPAPGTSSLTKQGLSSRKSSVVKLSVNGARLNEISLSTPNPAASHKRSREASSADDPGAGETSEGGRKKIKLRLNSTGGGSGTSPQGSRAGSPTMAPSNTSPASGAGPSKKSPAAGDGSDAGTPGANTGGFPTEEEVAAALTPEGLTVTQLIHKFRGRSINTADLMAMLKKVATYGSDKLLRPREPGSTPATKT